MHSDILIPSVLEAVRRAGNLFLAEYKQTPIPQDRAKLLYQLQRIDNHCLASLRTDLLPLFADTPWPIGDEFDSAGQKQPLDLPQYWLCDAMDGAIQYLHCRAV